MLWLVLGVVLVALGVWFGRRLPAAPPPADPPLGAPSEADAGGLLAADDTTLDLHGVPDREVDDLVIAFLDDACAHARTPVVIVHGKGIGVRRTRVRALLSAHPGVLRFGEPADRGRHRGATAVDLDPRAFGVAPTEPSA